MCVCERARSLLGRHVARLYLLFFIRGIHTEPMHSAHTHTHDNTCVNRLQRCARAASRLNYARTVCGVCYPVVLARSKQEAYGQLTYIVIVVLHTTLYDIHVNKMHIIAYSRTLIPSSRASRSGCCIWRTRVQVYQKTGCCQA